MEGNLSDKTTEYDQDSYEYKRLIAGKIVLKTNEKNLSGQEIISSYKNLSKIESSFKDMKCFFDIRQIYHRENETVKGHILVVLTYLLQMVLENPFKREKGVRITASRILKSLSRIRLVVNEVNNHKFGTLTELTNDVKSILKKTGMERFSKTTEKL